MQRYVFRGSKPIFGLFIATLMIPGQVTMLPLFMMFAKVGWTNSFIPLILPGVLINTYGVFMLRSFIVSIPDELLEAADVDGCSWFRKYRKNYPSAHQTCACDAWLVYVHRQLEQLYGTLDLFERSVAHNHTAVYCGSKRDAHDGCGVGADYGGVNAERYTACDSVFELSKIFRARNCDDWYQISGRETIKIIGG